VAGRSSVCSTHCASRRWPWMPNPLGSRAGRLASFFLLYFTEGVPFGFTATAVATYMRREGVPADLVTMFVGMLYLPWSWKWLIGPVVDIVYSRRLGRRRGWILAAHAAMVLSLMLAMPIQFSDQLKLFTVVILLHNVFAATQDVAIDALACSVLQEQERGLANGLMYAGAYVGQAVGGSGVLFLVPYTGFKATFFFVAACILSVTLFVVLPMFEPPGGRTIERRGTVLQTIASNLREYVLEAFWAIFGSPTSIAVLAFALLPAGAFALSLALTTNLAVELGMSDRQVGAVTLAVTLVSAGSCIVGGYLSDRFGRRRMLALFIASTAVPTLWLGIALWRHGLVMAADPDQLSERTVAEGLVLTYWCASLLHAACHGLMYGSRIALFMDVCDPDVAATQFSAYMALLNLVTFYTGVWQGYALRHWGYPTMLFIDACFGLACLAALPFIKPRRPPGQEPAGANAG